MAINFNAEPYYDDFDQAKNYHRILFRPGYAVQARELTQLQTQLQDQIKKFGDHIFVEGTVVLDGQRFFEKELTHIKIGNELFQNLLTQDQIIGLTVTGATSGTQALIKGISSESGIGFVLVVKLTSGTSFTVGENIEIVVNTTTYTSTIIEDEETFSGSAMMFSSGSGIYYVGGKFVYTEEQTIVVDALSNTSSKNVGFILTETAISAEDDETLLDNAQGTPNYAAPGADRYGVELVLSSKNFETVNNNFVEIARIEDGELILNLEKTIYSEIGNELARRTFDESGDYTVKPWKIQLEENPTDADTFDIKLEPGKGYIKGYEFETINQTSLTLDKGRDTASVVGSNTTITYGNFVFVSSLTGVFNTNTLESVNLKDVGNNTIGTARVRYLEYVTGTIGATGAIYRMYLFAITMNTGKTFAEVTDVTSTTGVASIDNLSKVDGSGDTFISGTDSPGLVFQSINQFIDNVSGIQQRFQKVYTGVTFTSGSGSILAGSGETFVGGTGTISNTNKDLYYHAIVTGSITGNTAVVTGSIASDTLTVTAVSSGSLNVGDTISGSGITSGTKITALVSGTGGTGTYKVTPSQSASSTTITGILTVGQVLTFSSGTPSVKSVTVSGSPQTATFNIISPVGFTATIIATFDKNDQGVRSKTLSGFTKAVITNTLNQTIGGTDTLALSDIENIYGVYNIGSNTGSTVTVNSSTGVIDWDDPEVAHTDVTSNYILDNGQRAEFYDHGGLVLVGTPPVTNTDNLLVVYKSFSHGGSGFVFTADSYSVDYEDIPTFTDPSSGKVYNLRDCFDFRPRREDNLTTFTTVQIPSPNSTLEADYDYYLGRMDRIIAMPDKRFLVKRGIPDLFPVLPVNDTNGMVIYEVIIPPYTATAEDVSIKYVDNKRYTMQDIGKLDKRIKNLEYYTQLSILEKQAKDTSIPDSSNFEKFKNGIAVDPFSSQDIFVASGGNWVSRRWGWWNAWFNGSNNWNSFGAQNYNENSIAEPANIDFNAAIDPLNQELRAPFEIEHQLFDVTTLDDTEQLGSLVTLDYTETTFINQPLFTSFININPFDVIKFVGKIDLEPPFDNWIETNILPAVNKIVDVRVPDAEDATIQNITGRGNRVRITSTSTSIVTNTIGSTTASLGASVVDVQYVPFIRASTVIVTGKLFKPNARLWPFVESTPISADCKPLTVLTITPSAVTTQSGTMTNESKSVTLSGSNANIKVGQYITGTYIAVGTRVEAITGASLILSNPATGSGTATLSFLPAGELFDDTQGVNELLTFTGGATARTALYTPPTSANPARRLLYVYGVTGTISNGNTITGAKGGVATVSAVPTTYSLGASIIPNEFGSVAFEFQIPEGEFKTGERTIRLIDNELNDLSLQESFGEAKYTATGIIQSKQETILTTRTLQNQRVTTETGVRFQADPLAQTFFIDDVANPSGIFVSSVEVYFRTKSSTIPVTMQIRTTANGYPLSVPTIPFSEVTLDPESVTVSADGSAVTKFTFNSPVHLVPGEYAIVLIANTSEYNVFIAETGQTVLNGSRVVDKQPYTGSLFVSQNARTWTADQNKDLAFKINRAEFSTSGYVEFDVQNPAVLQDYHNLFINASVIAPSNTQISWEIKTLESGGSFDTTYTAFNVNQDVEFSSLKRLVTSGNALRLKATLTNNINGVTNTKVSPAVDVASLAAVTILNDINNVTTGETGIQGGSALAKYITKPIVLADGFDASNLCVTLDINRPSGTNVKVYYKALPTEKTTPIANESWIEMELENTITSTSTSYEYKEHRFFPAGAFDAFGVPEDSPITTRFNTFQVKIVMLSNNVILSPKCRDLRIIALDQ